jgi:hypothetical protein
LFDPSLTTTQRPIFPQIQTSFAETGELDPVGFYLISIEVAKSAHAASSSACKLGNFDTAVKRIAALTASVALSSN